MEEKIMQIISEKAMKKVQIDDEILSDGLIDSISAVDLALDIEAEFNCAIPAHEIGLHMKTPRVLIEYVRNNKQ